VTLGSSAVMTAPVGIPNRKVNISLLLAVVFISAFIDGLDGSIVNIALPDIATDMSADTTMVSWVSITYMLVLASTLVPFAKMASTVSVRRIMTIGLTIFTVSSLVCGLSSSFIMLVTARVVQGLGAAMISAAGPICCTRYLSISRLGTGLGIITAGTALGFALGPAVGGFILDMTTWHWIFFINLIPGAVGVLGIVMSVPKENVSSKPDVDWPGAVSLCIAIASGTFCIESLVTPDAIVSSASFSVSIIAMMAFIHIERRSEKPLLNLSMFAYNGFMIIFLSMILMNMAYMGILYITPFYCTVCMGLQSSEIGILVMTSAITTAIFSIPVARWSNSSGRRMFCVVSGLFLAGSMSLLILFARDMTIPMMVVSMVLKGLGWAFMGGPMASNLIEHSRKERDMASSLMNEAYYIGGTVGTALIAVVFAIMSSTSGIGVQDITESAFIDGFVPVVAIVLSIGILVSVLSVFVKDDKEKTFNDRTLT
jgi:EmrB/QacA subfamily drug resistance transporter